MWGHRHQVSEQGIVHTSDGPQAFVSLCCHPGKADADGGDFALCLEDTRRSPSGKDEERGGAVEGAVPVMTGSCWGQQESRGKGTAKHPCNDLRMRGQSPAWKTRIGCLGSWSHSGQPRQAHGPATGLKACSSRAGPTLTGAEASIESLGSPGKVSQARPGYQNITDTSI